MFEYIHAQHTRMHIIINIFRAASNKPKTQKYENVRKKRNIRRIK